jgi:transcriptional regulator with XRE-family HTH domain
MNHGQTPMGQTRFAQRLQEWMSSQHPPCTSDQFATWLHVPMLTVANWLNGRSVPDPGVLSRIAHYTRLPLAELYELAGVPIPEPIAPPAPSEDELWERALADILMHLRAEGYGEAGLQEAVARARKARYGVDYTRHVRAEFARPTSPRNR